MRSRYLMKIPTAFLAISSSVFLVLGLSSCSGAINTLRTAGSILRAVDSTVVWDSASTIVGDIDCDNHVDTAVLGKASKTIQVGIVFGVLTPPNITMIDVAPAVQNALPTSDVFLTTESIDYDPASEGDGPGELEGFQRSSTCIGLNLSDGETDSLHMYWNHKANQLDWWRR